MTILERKVFISSNPRIVLSSCPPPCGHFSIQESATGGLSYKVKNFHCFVIGWDSSSGTFLSHIQASYQRSKSCCLKKRFPMRQSTDQACHKRITSSGSIYHRHIFQTRDILLFCKICNVTPFSSQLDSQIPDSAF